MITKTEFWQRIWTKWKKRKPPETKELILIWNPIMKIPIVMEAAIARYGAIAMENGKDISPDRVYKKWCYITPPKRK